MTKTPSLSEFQVDQGFDFLENLFRQVYVVMQSQATYSKGDLTYFTAVQGLEDLMSFYTSTNTEYDNERKAIEKEYEENLQKLDKDDDNYKEEEQRIKYEEYRKLFKALMRLAGSIGLLPSFRAVGTWRSKRRKDWYEKHKKK